MKLLCLLFTLSLITTSTNSFGCRSRKKAPRVSPDDNFRINAFHAHCKKVEQEKIQRLLQAKREIIAKNLYQQEYAALMGHAAERFIINFCEIKKKPSASPEDSRELFTTSTASYLPIVPKFIFGKPIE